MSSDARISPRAAARTKAACMDMRTHAEDFDSYQLCERCIARHVGHQASQRLAY